MSLISLVYSIPRFGSRRVRQSPWLTKVLVVSFRGVIFPTVGFLTVWSLVSTQPLEWVYLAFIITFAVPFCVGMNNFADIPDMKGDLESGYRSFALTLGATKTAYLCFAAFATAFLGLSFWILAFPQLFRIEWGLPLEAVFLGVFVIRFRRMLHSELQFDGQGAKSFYTFLWCLYAIQYISLIPIFSAA
jgi:4-hydroxybenzoate polyprenyltransferase